MPSVDKKAGGDLPKIDSLDVRGTARDAKGWFSRAIDDVGKGSAARQIAIGGVSGWCTGFLSMKVGKLAATAVGGGIILLQIANHKGYIKINWNKVYGDVEKVSNKIQEEYADKPPTWLDKAKEFAQENQYASNYVDRKLDKAEDALKKGERKAQRWYNKFVYGDEPFKLKEIHIFFAAFTAGVAIGVVSA